MSLTVKDLPDTGLTMTVQDLPDDGLTMTVTDLPEDSGPTYINYRDPKQPLKVRQIPQASV